MPSESRSSSTSRPPGAPPEGHRIKRKPVSRSNSFIDDAKQGVPDSLIPGKPLLQPPEGPPPPYESPQLSPQLPTRPPLISKASSNTVPDIVLHEDQNCPDASTPRPVQPRAVTDTPPSSSQSTSPSPVQKAYGEARHFLGGLINHPTESNRHFTILRHSYGVVFYRGSTTSVTVSIFSDTPLPPDRTLWLQNKGWTGKTGMRAKALFRLHDDWINVTPSIALHADQVEPADERAWQRDIAKFRKKAPAKIRDAHQLRQTVMARIPVEAGDGYFQLVLCQGVKKKVLCSSPVFRVLSTSMDPSSIRGASLSTLPLEVGAMVLSAYAQTAARTVLTPASVAVQNKIQAHHPSATKETAAQAAFSISDVGNRIGSVLNHQAPDQEAGFMDAPDNMDQGPVAPFPVNFKAQGEPRLPASQYELQDSPTVNLTKIPDIILDRLHGYFICWTRLYQTDKKADDRTTPWYPSILSVRNIDHSTTTRVNMSHIRKRTTILRFLDDIQLSLHAQGQVKLQVRVMRYLRPEIPAPTASSEQELARAREAAAEAALLADSCDTSYALTILDHPDWAPECPTLEDSQKENGMRLLDKTRDGYATARTRIEKTPLHWLGVRSAMAGKMDQQITVNGFYIVR